LASDEQPLGQLALAPLHKYGVQLGLPLEPADTTVHAPRLPATLHASQLPPQAVLQQRPSTQLPLWHALAPLHAAPLVCFGLH
jgi:hypothetical protein